MLKFIIKGQTIKRVDTHKLVQYAQEYPTAEFEFDEDWNGLDKTIQWNMADETYDTPIEDGTSVVPWELLRNKGTINVNVVGITENKVITTNTVSIDVMGCGIVGGMVSGTPSESYYNNIDKRVQINSDDIADIKENGKLKALAVAEDAVFDGEVKLKDGIKLKSAETDEDGNPWQEVDISDKSGIRITSRSSESDTKRYIRIGKPKGGDGAGADDIASGLQFCDESDDGDFYVVCGKNGNIYLIRLSVDAGIQNVIMGNETLEILSGLSGSNGYISFDSSRAGIKYTKATWTEILKQLDVSTTKGINMEAQNNSYWWVNAAKKAQYGNSLNRLEFRTDGVAKFSNTVNASDYQIGGTPVLDKAEETSETLARNAAFAMMVESYNDSAVNKDTLLNYLLDGGLSGATTIQIGDNVYAVSTDKTVVIRGSGATYDYTEPMTGTSYSWTADDLTLSDTLTENPVLGTIFSYTAGVNSAITANNKTFSDGKSFTRRLQYKGSATVGGDGSFTINAPSAGKLIVYFVTGSNSEERTIRLFSDNAFEVLGSASSGPVVSGYVYKAAVFDIPKAGTYYIACRDAAVNYYGMTFTQESLFSGKNVYVLNGVTKLGDYIFAETDLESVYAAYSVTTLGDHTFYGIQCNKITLNGVTTFNGSNSETFRYANIDTLIFGTTVTQLFDNDFSNACIGEIKIKTNGINGTAFDSANIGGKINIDTDTFLYRFGSGTFGEIEIRANQVGQYAFSINNAVFPYISADKVKIIAQSVGQRAFWRNKINDLSICASNISSRALAEMVCEDIIIDGAKVLGIYTLYKTEADKVSFKNADSLDLGFGAIYDASIPTIELCWGITTFDTYAFAYNEELKEIAIPSTVVEIANFTFAGCTNLKKITVNNSENDLMGAPWGAPNATVIWTG